MIPALISCRNALAERGVATLAFDCAFVQYHALTSSGRDIRADYPELFKLGPGIIGDVLEFANDAIFHIPGGTVLKNKLSKLGADTARWYHSRGQLLVEHLKKLDAPANRGTIFQCSWGLTFAGKRPSGPLLDL
jgi:hypothetical protein